MHMPECSPEPSLSQLVHDVNIYNYMPPLVLNQQSRNGEGRRELENEKLKDTGCTFTFTYTLGHW